MQEDKYRMAVEAHAKFFHRASQNETVQVIVTAFEREYDEIDENRPFQCDISDLPSISRILLIKKLTQVNLERSKKIIHIEFSLDGVVFGTTLLPKEFKRGNLQVHGIGNYEEIQQFMYDICSYLHPVVIVRVLRAARRAGRSITHQSVDYFDGQRNRLYDPQDVDFLNRFMFLWDCEVARLLQIPATTDDPERDSKEQLFYNLPIGLGISSIHFFIEQRNYDFNYYLTKTNRYHLFTGEAREREGAVKNIMHHRSFHSPEELFDELAYEFGEENFGAGR
jgi:hypothetical protein